MVVDDPSTCKANFILTGIEEVTLASWVTEPNPLAATTMWYELRGTFVNSNWPELSAVVVRE
jgi:hypothetical protein